MFDPDFVPDMIVMGKPIANGMPIGAIVTTQEIMERFRQRQYFFSTFGGNPVATSAGLAVLDVLKNEQLQAKAADTGEYVLAKLRRLQGAHPCIGRVTGRGLFFGLDIIKDPDTKEPDGQRTSLLQNRMRELGVLIGTEGIHDNYLKIRPPMPFGKEHGDLMLQALEQALEEVA
jgi:4-aminobutyrate aminotransferase-like enzyme